MINVCLIIYWCCMILDIVVVVDYCVLGPAIPCSSCPFFMPSKLVFVAAVG